MKFLKNDLISGSDQIRDSFSKKDHSDRLVVIHNIPQPGVVQSIIETSLVANNN